MRPLSVSQWVSERFIVSEIAIAPSSFQACMNIVMIVSTDYGMNHHAHSKTTQTDIFPLYKPYINDKRRIRTVYYVAPFHLSMWVTNWFVGHFLVQMFDKLNYFILRSNGRVFPGQKVNREQSWTANCPSVCLCIFALSRLVWPISWEHQL